MTKDTKDRELNPVQINAEDMEGLVKLGVRFPDIELLFDDTTYLGNVLFNLCSMDTTD